MTRAATKQCLMRRARKPYRTPGAWKTLTRIWNAENRLNNIVHEAKKLLFEDWIETPPDSMKGREAKDMFQLESIVRKCKRRELFYERRRRHAKTEEQRRVAETQEGYKDISSTTEDEDDEDDDHQDART